MVGPRLAGESGWQPAGMVWRTTTGRGARGSTPTAGGSTVCTRTHSSPSRAQDDRLRVGGRELLADLVGQREAGPAHALVDGLFHLLCVADQAGVVLAHRPSPRGSMVEN